MSKQEKKENSKIKKFADAVKRALITSSTGKIMAGFVPFIPLPLNTIIIESALNKVVKSETKKVELKFNEFAEQWYRETLHSSGYLDKVLHPSYQQIIGLGEDAIPFILRELQDQPSEWFWALRALTGKDPTTPEQAGKRDEMAKAWLDWGKENGYI